MNRNILLILTDQQHYRSLGCTGATEARTPNLDALAARGMLFRNHFVTNPVCSPSRGSIMTGLYPTENGLWGNGCRLPDNVPTVAQTLAAAGWQTAHFGKLHLVPIITRIAPHPPYGFQTCEVAEGDQQLLDDDYFRWLRTTDPDLFVRYLTEMYEQGHAKGYTSLMPEEKHLTTWVTRRAVDWLQHRRDPSKPFFLSVGYFDPHHAFNPCEPYASQFASADVTPPVFDKESIATRPPHYRQRFESSRVITRDHEKMTAIQRAYHAMVAHIDKCVGELLRELPTDTVVIFSSDHGEFLGNHGLLWKGPFLLDDLLRVPLIVAGPGVPVGVTDELTSAVDLKPTIETLAGVGAGSPRAFLDAAGKVRGRDHVLAEWEAPGDGPTRSLRMIRTRDSKLITYAPDSDWGECYDVRHDPHEFYNRYADPVFAARRAELAAAIPRRPRPAVPCEGGW
jgi:arylsulfatase A-like enzyme